MLDLYCTEHKIVYKHSIKNAIRNNGCPECRPNGYTQQQFIELVRQQNPHIEVIGKYIKQDCHVKCRCKIHDIIFNPHSTSLIHGNGGCPICRKQTVKEKRSYKSEELKEMFHALNPSLVIVDDNVELNNYVTIYCKDCKQTFQKILTSSYIHFQKSKCLVCSNRVIVEGINDVATTRPDLIKYYVNKNESKLYGKGQIKKLKFQCPDCGYQKDMQIEVLARQGFSCPCCGDGISYPNKFIRALLKQLPIDNLKFEYSSKWTDKYFYDCYFKYNDMEYVIEIDGVQHYKEQSSFRGNISFEQQKKTDAIKTQLAIQNNVTMIRIDASKSELQYIKNNIEKSILNDIFDLKNINWEDCDKFSTSNLVKKVCEYAEKIFPDNYVELHEYFHLSKSTLNTYIKKGIKYGWCSKRTFEKMTFPKKIAVYDDNENYIDTYISAKKCGEEIGKITGLEFSASEILKNCRGIIDSYKNYVFKFAYNII